MSYNQALTSGTWIGNCSCAGTQHKVCIPEKLRGMHSHIIGAAGTEKTKLLEHMILSDIREGLGVVVMEPHGDLIERILKRIPKQHIDRVIYFDPGDPDWTPLWNPLKQIVPEEKMSQKTEYILRVIKRFFSPTGWNDCLDYLLRNIIFSLTHLPQFTFLDIILMLHNDNNMNWKLRQEILKVIDNKEIRNFWLNDYKKYRKEELGHPKNILSKLLINNTVTPMLSQPESKINFRKIMDEGGIFLANFSTIGASLKNILGSFVLSNLQQATLSRSNIPIDERKQFHIYVDDAHQFLMDTIENMIFEIRRYGVSLTLAHQHLSQFDKKTIDALSTVGTKIIFRVGEADATLLQKELGDLVTVDALVSLPPYESIVRIGADTVRISTRDSLKVSKTNFKDQIIKNSRDKYYLSAHKVRKMIHQRNEHWNAK